ncbi:YARS2, partial [Cordylochernes scorpioides]
MSKELGGTTGMFGDPSGRIKARNTMSREVLETNLASIKQGILRIISHHREYFWPSSQTLADFKVLDNSSWYLSPGAMDLHAQLLGSFKKGTLLNRTSVRVRKERGDLRLNELFYQCLQAHDWKHLLEQSNCRFQTDQYMVSYLSVAIYQQKTDLSTALMLPLLLTSSGEKYGKSANNATWLEPHKTSPFLFYQ